MPRLVEPPRSDDGRASPNNTRRSSRNLSLLLKIITVLIAVVLANQWHLASRYYHESDAHYFTASLSSFLGQNDSKRPSQLGIPLEGSYITSRICRPCYRTLIPNSKSSCFDLLDKSLATNASLADAAQKLTLRHPECLLCIPEKCYDYYRRDEQAEKVEVGNEDTEHRYKYWRYDRAAPKFTNPTTLTLNVIPPDSRIPPSRFDDIAKFFEEQYRLRLKSPSNSTGIDFLLEYNPGIVTLPANLKRSLPEEAAYLLSLRVTPANNCFATDVYNALEKDVWDSVYHTSTNHLGLALLDSNYDMLPGYEIVIELDKQLDLKRVIPGSGDVSPTFMDYRIFLLNNEVYLHANADTTTVTKLKLHAKGYPDLHRSVNKDPSDDKEGLRYRNFRLTNLYGGDQLEVFVEHQFNTIWSGGIKGKNYALFGIPNETHPDAEDSVYAEIDITSTHRVHQMILDEYDHISLYQVFELLWKPFTRKRRNFKIDQVNRRSMRTVGNITEVSDAPLPSFPNVDTVWYPGNKAPFKESVHGGACCVLFTKDELNIGGSQSNHHESLLVGIAHTKVPWRPWYNRASQQDKELLPHTHYVTLFYAFDAYPPFKLRARSGFFCLGFVPETNDNSLPASEGGRFNPHNVLTRNRKLRQNNETFDCPQMSFVSSFTQKADDASRLVIGYGLNDCTGRLVEVTKQEVVRLLFPPLDMVVENVQTTNKS